MKYAVIAGCLLAVANVNTSLACSNSILTVKHWSIKPVSDDINELTVELTSSAAKGIRMVDGMFMFSDALGGKIASAAIDRDAHISPSGTYKQTGHWGMYTFERLLNLQHEEVSIETCVRAVLYEDGSKQTF